MSMMYLILVFRGQAFIIKGIAERYTMRAERTWAGYACLHFTACPTLSSPP